MDYIKFALSNFGLTMFGLAVFFILLHLSFRIKNISLAEVIYRWVALFGLGLTGIYTGMMHVFYPEIAASTIGWQLSPFQFEVGMADLALGMLGVLSFRGTYGFRRATVIAALCMLWGDAMGHLYQMMVYQNFTDGNAGSWLMLDLAIPAILAGCVLKLKPLRRRHA